MKFSILKAFILALGNFSMEDIGFCISCVKTIKVKLFHPIGLIFSGEYFIQCQA